MSTHKTICIIPPGTVVFVRTDYSTVIRQEVTEVRMNKDGIQYVVARCLRDPEIVHLSAEKAFLDDED